MSTNTTTVHQGSVRSARGGFAALLAAILLATATMVALTAGQPAAGIAPEAASDAQVQKALIDVRAGERASLGVASDADVQKALIDVRAGERESLSGAVPPAGSWEEFRAGK